MSRSKYPPLLRPPIEEVPFNHIVSEWDEGRQVTGEILAMTNNGAIASAAFKAACEERPNRDIVWCNGARIVKRSTPARAS